MILTVNAPSVRYLVKGTLTLETLYPPKPCWSLRCYSTGILAFLLQQTNMATLRNCFNSIAHNRWNFSEGLSCTEEPGGLASAASPGWPTSFAGTSGRSGTPSRPGVHRFLSGLPPSYLVGCCRCLYLQGKRKTKVTGVIREEKEDQMWV